MDAYTILKVQQAESESPVYQCLQLPHMYYCSTQSMHAHTLNKAVNANLRENYRV